MNRPIRVIVSNNRFLNQDNLIYYLYFFFRALPSLHQAGPRTGSRNTFSRLEIPVDDVDSSQDYKSNMFLVKCVSDQPTT
jgi:hypothetical protein